MKIAHFADTHIHNLKEHENYYYVFEKIYKSLRDLNVDYIVHAGDVVNNKVSITPELVVAVKDFFERLSDIAPVIVVLGNHDGLVNNKDRIDTVSAIVGAIKKNNITVLRDTATIPLSEDIFLHSLSIYSNTKPWEELKIDTKKINIGVFHGTVGNVMLDTGFYLEGEPLEKFCLFDFMMLGHIHRMQYLDKQKRIWYAGSTVQGGYSESAEKGFLLWEINGKNDFRTIPYLFEPLNRFQTIQILSLQNFYLKSNDYGIYNNSNLLVILSENVSYQEEKQLEKFLLDKFNAKSVKISKKLFEESLGPSGVADFVSKINLGDLSTQQYYIRQHLLEVLQITDESVIQKVLELNAKMSADQQAEDVKKMWNKFNIRRIEWGNLFSYGVGNVIDLAKYSSGSILGIMGENFSGKSSVFDVLCFVLWGETTKKVSRNADILRAGEKSGYGIVVFEHNGEEYVVERVLERIKGDNVKVKLTFSNVSANKDHNVETKKGTERELSKIIGEFDDFLILSFLSQGDLYSFVTLQNAEKKNILKRILNLNVFDEKIKYVNEKIYELNIKMKNLPQDELIAQLEKIEERLLEAEKNKFVVEKELEARESAFSNLLTKKVELENQIRNLFFDQEVQNDSIESLLERREQLKGKYLRLRERLNNAKNVVVEPVLPRFVGQMEIFDVLKGLREKVGEFEEKIKEKKERIMQEEMEIKSLEEKIEELRKNVRMDVPCVANQETYNSCPLAKEQIENHTRLLWLEEQVEIRKKHYFTTAPEVFCERLRKECEQYRRKIEYLEDYLGRRLPFYEKCVQEIQKIENSIKNEVIPEYKRVLKKIHIIENNKKNITLRKELENELNNVVAMLERSKKDVFTKKNELNSYISEIASAKSAISSLKKKRAEIQEIIEEFSVIKIYKNVLSGENSILNSLLRKFVPEIERLANEFLSNFGGMSIVFDMGEKDVVSILYKTTSRDHYRSIGVASGSEKMMVSMALRSAFIRVNNLPSSNIFILDEPGTTFDEERLVSLEKALYLLRGMFDYVFLVTHIASLKEASDTVFYVTRENNVSIIN